MHPEIVKDLTEKTNTFASKWYRRHLYPNHLFQYRDPNYPYLKLYEGGLGLGYYNEIRYEDGKGYTYVCFCRPEYCETVYQTTDWEDMKRAVDEYFTSLHQNSYMKVNGGTRDGTGKCQSGSGRGGTCETQGGVAGCGCAYGAPCSGRRQVYSTQAQGEYGSYFRAGSPVPERKVATGSS
jgi:hypothetical protein